MMATRFRPLMIGGAVAAIGLAALVLAGPLLKDRAEPVACSSCDARHKAMTARVTERRALQGSALTPPPQKAPSP